MSARVEVQFASRTAGDLACAAEVEAWAEAALGARRTGAGLTVRFVDEAEGTTLNERYRKRRGPTNVLSFPYDPPPGVHNPLLGDIAVCAPVAVREAREQGKTARAHCAHLVVHATLHLLGYDHQNEEDARRMESQETAILARLGFDDPYEPAP